MTALVLPVLSQLYWNWMDVSTWHNTLTFLEFPRHILTVKVRSCQRRFSEEKQNMPAQSGIELGTLACQASALTTGLEAAGYT